MSRTPSSDTHAIRPGWLVAVVVIAVFLFCVFGRKFILQQLGITQVDTVWHLFAMVYTWYWLPPVLVAVWVAGWRRSLGALGLQSSFLLALAIGFACTLPMLIGYGLNGQFSPTAQPHSLILQSAVFPALMEEILYRGLLFGLLFRYARWGFIPAALIGAAMFGAGHLYQGLTLAAAAGSFAVTAVGALWFAWLYVEWRNNLWVPVFLHLFMNLYWILFAMGESAVGGMSANLFRMATIALSVFVTLLYVRKHGTMIHNSRWWRSN